MGGGEQVIGRPDSPAAQRAPRPAAPGQSDTTARDALQGFRSRAAALLRADGERATAARLDVLDVLAAASAHLSAAEIHRRVEAIRPGTNLSTVYRTLDRLVELSLAHGLATGSETTFGLALNAHHHVVCDSCGRTVSVDSAAVEALLAELGERSGMRVHALEAHGLCVDCGRPATALQPDHPHP